MRFHYFILFLLLILCFCIFIANFSFAAISDISNGGEHDLIVSYQNSIFFPYQTLSGNARKGFPYKQTRDVCHKQPFHLLPKNPQPPRGEYMQAVPIQLASYPPPPPRDLVTFFILRAILTMSATQEELNF